MELRKIISWITITGSIASVVALTILFFPKKRLVPELEFLVNSYENLTTLNISSEPEIEARFTYKGADIFKLWRIDITIENKSDKTLIGSGQQKNIMFDNLVFYIDTSFQLIDKKIIKSDFDHSLQIINLDTFQISFGQWRSKEQLCYALYLKTDSIETPTNLIFRQPDVRQIVDWNIVIRDIEETDPKTLITDGLGRPVKIIGYSLIICVLILLGVMSITILISNIGGFILRRKWYRNNHSQFRIHIKSLKIPEERKLALLQNPGKYTSWDSFDGEKYPDDWGADFEFTKLLPFLATTFFITILTFSLLIIIFDLVQLFP